MLNTEKITLESYISQCEGNIVSDMDGEKVMMSIKNGKYYNLGEIGGVIWEGITEPTTVQDLIKNLLTQFEVEQSPCEDQVIKFLEHLQQEGLIENK
jgi:hypothetical protein